MGIEIWSFRAMIDHRDRIKGNFLMLGRQEVHLLPPIFHMESRVSDYLAERGIDDLDFGCLNGYAERFCKWLGATNVDSMDYAPYESASILHDLNEPVSADLKGRFDVIYDGGTLEHVFHFPNAVNCVKEMLKPGGIFISINGANNFLGHGFYQFSPELMWRVFNSDGFKILSVKLTHNADLAFEMPDPESEGKRQEIGLTPGASYVVVVAEKLRDPSNAAVLQSDYQRIWGSST